ncbi:hypothetical protein IL306_002349 [Fusarium sp. DS 682]|nr:hypothetical protein IL306_002349 [Fusarium sp. DS 682]
MTRQDWHLIQANSERGSRTLDILFKGMNDGIRTSWGSHSEISWISINISYRLFLADHRILDIVETELVVLPGIMCHNLGRETSWHVAASQNVGIAPQDVRAIQLAANLVAELAGLNLSNIEILEV